VASRNFAVSVDRGGVICDAFLSSTGEELLGEIMNASATKFGVNAAAAAVVAAAAIVPLQAATAAPVSDYASQWSQTVGSTFSDLTTAPAFLSDPAAAPWFCFSSGNTCLTPDSTIIWSFDFGAFLGQIPGVPQSVIDFVNQFNWTSCTFGNCFVWGPYGTGS